MHPDKVLYAMSEKIKQLTAKEKDLIFTEKKLEHQIKDETE